MASAQVLPNSAASSKKQGHLEAGKRRLEEFRKKKAEGRTKKAASTGQLQSDDVNQREKIPQENEKDEFLVSVGPPSQEDGVTDPETSGSFTNHDSKPNNSVHIGEQDPINVRDADVSIEQSTGNPQSKLYEGSGYQGPEYNYYNLWKGEKNGESSKFSGNEGEPTSGVTTELAPDPIHRYSKFVENSHQFDFSLRKSHLEENESSSKVDLVKDSRISSSSFTGSLPGKLSSSPLQSKEGSFWPNHGTSTSYGNSAHLTSNSTDFPLRVEPHIGDNTGYRSAWSSEMQEKDIRNTVDQNTMESSPWRSSGIFSSNSEVDFRSSSNQTLPVMPETGLRRSHPSFLDSLNVSRELSASRFTFSDSGKVETSYPFRNSKVNATESVTPSGSLHPFTELGTLEPFVKSVSPDYVNTAKLSENTSASVKDDNLLMMHDFAAPKKDENFAALEQHIEDLTQEKFSLQRSLESSRALAESLAAENSSVSDSFNQQGMIVNQLKSDMERLQEEITDHLAQLEALKMEYCNAQLECSAADERAKILASEVIGLEEKVLRLRSNELKLERQLENSTNEINSYKRKVSSLEKEHHNLQSTVNALQEEKKMLQFKLRKASANGKVSETEKAPITKDISTSTEDLGEVYFVEDAGVTVSVSSTDNELGPSVVSLSNTSSLPSLPESREHSLDASTAIPHDQLRMITNINFLVSELVLEKEDLLRALALESSNTSKLKDLNKELSQKLEAQTQRLELLTAQRMASETIQVKTPDANSNHDSTMYTDEGDEVVERVLNWVMKLFPGGPAKRRTSKLL